MLEVDIPGFGIVRAEHPVSDNDGFMLMAARIGIAVSEGEGCAVHAPKNADIHVRSIGEGLDLLLHPDRLKATLRY